MTEELQTGAGTARAGALFAIHLQPSLRFARR